MKKIYSIILAILPAVVLVSCSDEWEPVFNAKYDVVDPYTPASGITANTSIADLKALYVKEGSPVHIESDIIIGGQVISEDRSGNIYRSLYIQDKTGAMEIKIGKSALYNDYKLGQWVFVKCKGLILGNYNGMLQIGFEDPTGSYETAYLDVDYLIGSHVFRGEVGTPVSPVELTEDQVKQSVTEGFQSNLLGTYVTLKGLKYGCKPDQYSSATKRIFALLYIDPNKDTKSTSNRIFLSSETYNVTTWAMSKENYLKHLNAGDFDSATSADDLRKVSDEDLKEQLVSSATPVTVSQYFLMGNTEVQIRTSGYARFADTEIDAGVLSGVSTVDVKGILTNYQGDAQFTLLDISDVQIN